MNATIELPKWLSKGKTCAKCGKEFVPAPQHVYKEVKDGNTVWYCSWTCFNHRNGGNHMKNCKPTQAQRVLDYIKEFGSITQIEALRDLGVMRLASRITDLRRQGVRIKSVTDTVKNRYGESCHIKRYSLKES